MDRWIGIRVSQILFAIMLTGCFVTLSVAKEDTTDVGTVIRIDLGTTYSCVGVYRNGHVEIIPNDQGNRITPSWMAFTDNERLIGEAAKNQASLNPERIIFDVKRLIGRRFDDPEVQRHIKLLPYEIVNKDGKPYIQVKIRDGETKVFSPEEISAMILTKMKETVEAFLGKTIKDAVIAVPAYFNDAQRQATRDAGTIAGLKVGLINELTATVIAYNIDEKGDKKNILVYDLGGGTFDVNILRVDGRVFDILATNGDAHLGGEDFDRRIMEHFIKLIKKCGKDISEDKEALGKMRRECERAKRELSNQHHVRVEIESLYDGLNFSKWLARARFEELSGDLFSKIMGPVQEALEDAGLEKHQIDEIVLVGGGSRILKVQQLLKNYFDGKEPNMGVNPDEAVAYGAAILGTLLRGDFHKISGDILHLDLTPLGNEIIDGSITKLIIRETFIPTNESQDLTNAGLHKYNILIELLEGEESLSSRKTITNEVSGNSAKITITNEVPGNSAKTTITNEVRLSSGKTMRTVEEAEKFAEKVKEIKEKIDARNQPETYVENAKNTINDKDKLGDKLESKDKEEVEEDVKDALEDFDKKMEKLQATFDRIISAPFLRTWLL